MRRPPLQPRPCLPMPVPSRRSTAAARGGATHGSAPADERPVQLALDVGSFNRNGGVLADHAGTSVRQDARAKAPSPTDPRRAIRAAPITGRAVPPKWPEGESPPVYIALYGEAPGRYGADRSLCPFWGDKAAKVLYRALREAGVATWDGGSEVLDLFGIELVERGIMPRVSGIMLSNAYDRCPAAGPTRIRPPSRTELQSAENERRVLTELDTACAYGCRTVIALGKVAGDMLRTLMARGLSSPPVFTRIVAMELIVRPHPSALGLMQSNRHRSPGYRLAELEDDWVATTVTVIRNALAQAHGPMAPRPIITMEYPTGAPEPP